MLSVVPRVARASTYRRHLQWGSLPTSFLATVVDGGDASTPEVCGHRPSCFMPAHGLV